MDIVLKILKLFVYGLDILRIYFLPDMYILS